MKKRYIISFVLTAALLCFSHHIWLGHKTEYHFEFSIFIIIAVLSYLLFLKLSSYLADFKNLKYQSRIEIIFLAMFFTLLFIPMSNINQAERSKFENRSLAKWKPLIKSSGVMNYNFGKDYEKWFNDRFGYRMNLISFNQLKEFDDDTIGSPKFFFIKKRNWLFAKDKILNGAPHFSKDSVEYTASLLTGLNVFCKVHGIKLYVLIVPYSSYIYSSELRQYKSVHEKYVKETNKNIELLRAKTDTKIINLYNILANASKGHEYVYFKVDHHWTDYGAFWGYQKLMREIKNDFPNIHILGESDFNISYSKFVRSEFDRKYYEGNTLSNYKIFLGKSINKILDTEYRYYDFKDSDNLLIKIKNEKQEEGRDYFYPKGNNLKFLEMGTSMNENLLQFTAPTFRNTKYFRLNSKTKPYKERFKIMKYYKKDILDFCPDIAVLCITPEHLEDLKDIFAEDK